MSDYDIYTKIDELDERIKGLEKVVGVGVSRLPDETVKRYIAQDYYSKKGDKLATEFVQTLKWAGCHTYALVDEGGDIEIHNRNTCTIDWLDSKDLRAFLAWADAKKKDE